MRLVSASLLLVLVASTASAADRGRPLLRMSRELVAGNLQGAGLTTAATRPALGAALLASGTALGMLGKKRPSIAGARAAFRHPVRWMTDAGPYVGARVAGLLTGAGAGLIAADEASSEIGGLLVGGGAGLGLMEGYELGREP